MVVGAIALVPGAASAQDSRPPSKTVPVQENQVNETPFSSLAEARAYLGLPAEPEPMPRGGGDGTDGCNPGTSISGTNGTSPASNVGATNTAADVLAGACGGSGSSPDVWFTYSAIDCGVITFSFCPAQGGGASYDSVLEAYSDCPSAGGLRLACNDDFCALHSSITFPIAPATTYKIRVSGFAGATGSGTLGWGVLASAALSGTDDCASGTFISGPGTAFTGNIFASNTPGDLPAEACFPASVDRWFSYTPPANGTVVFKFCPAGGCASYDSVLAAYAGCGGAQIACNDDFCGLHSQISFAVFSGINYRIRVAGFSSNTGTGVLSWNLPVSCITCPAGGVAENEGNCGLPADSVNGGCNSTPDVYSPIAIGQTVCGTAAFDGTTRDTDWWGITLTSPTELTWTVSADFPVVIGMLGSPCPQFSFITGSLGQAAACTPVSSVVCLQPGTYSMFVAPQFTTPIGCGSRYMATLTGVSCATGACCAAGGCTVERRSDCTAAGGAYQGDGTGCGGQVYAAAACGNAFADISSFGTLAPNASNCDDCGDLVPLGFTFEFFGVQHTQINVCSNGYLTFGPDVGVFTNGVIPSTGVPNDLIAPYWDDWYTIISGDVYYQTLGAAPNRVFVAMWDAVQHFPGVDPSATFEAILTEGSNTIEFRYGVTNASDTPTIGIENADGTIGVNIPVGTQGMCQTITNTVLPNPCTSCPCDFNHSGGINSQDFFDFLNCFFNPGCTDADFNHSGTVNSQDFFDFLNCFFNPPPSCG